MDSAELRRELFPEQAAFDISADPPSQTSSGPFARPSTSRLSASETQNKMDAGATVPAGVTDGPIIQTHPSGHRKTPHLAYS